MIVRMTFEKTHYLRGHKIAKHEQDDENFSGSESEPENGSLPPKILTQLLPGPNDTRMISFPGFEVLGQSSSTLGIMAKFKKKMEKKRLMRTQSSTDVAQKPRRRRKSHSPEPKRKKKKIKTFSPAPRKRYKYK